MANPWDNDPIVSPAPSRAGGIYRDPFKDAEQAREEERLRLQQEAQSRASASQADAHAAAVRQQQEFEATHLPDGTPKPSLTQKQTPEVRQKALAQWNASLEIDRILGEMRDQYAKGPGATHGIKGVMDYLPSATNQTFDATANQSRGIVRNALGLTGGEANTAAEANMNLGGYLPQASDYDQNIVQKFQHLEGVRDNARRMAIQTLGGIPDANGNVTPLPAQNAMTQTYLSGADPMRAAPAGATMGTQPIPPDMQREYDAYIAKNVHNLNPDDYVAFRTGLDQKYGFSADPGKTEEYRTWAEGARKAGQQGGTVKTVIPGAPRKLSSLEQARNSLVSNPAMAGAVGAGNMMTLGIPEALAPDQTKALGNAQPLATGIGQVAGSIAGTSGLARLGAGTIGRAIPKLLEGGAKGQFARNLATDTLYSGMYGGMTGDNPMASAGWGAAGSVAGQGVGRGLGALVGGVATSPAVQALRARGIPLTVGQSMGGIPKAIEDAATSIPGVGDMINARRLDGLKQFNRSALNEAGAPIGAKVAETGKVGVDSLFNQIGDSYDDATRGVTVPLDPQFTTDLQGLYSRGTRLPPDLGAKFNTAITNRVGPIEQAGQLTGAGYQQAVRGIKGYRAEHPKPGFEQDYRDALSEAIDALTGQMQRGGGQRVVTGLNNANAAYKAAKVADNAINAAKNGSASGEIQIFTPAQLNTAAQQAASKFGGQRPMATLIDDAQRTLPSRIPDSGTARRGLTAALPALLGGGIGAGAGYAGGDTKEGMLKGLALGAALTAGGTKRGQAILTKILADRPDAAKALGRAIRKRKGLFGSSALPFFLEGNN